MHICYIENGYPPPTGGGGGAGTYVQLMGRELVKQGHKVSVVAKWREDSPEEYDDQGVIVYRPKVNASFTWYLTKLPLIGKYFGIFGYLEKGFKVNRFLQKLHKQSPIDVAEYSEGGDYFQAKRKTFPYITHLHGSSYTFRKMTNRPMRPGYWFGRKFQLFFIKHADFIFSPSNALLGIVSEEADHHFENVLVQPYPIDNRLLDKPDQIEEEADQIVMFAARNDWVKGADLLVKSAEILYSEFPKVKFKLYGYTPTEEEKLSPNVEYFSFIPKDELLKKYHSATFCVIPSRWDNSPNTVYEAMAAGKAIVAGRVGGIPELVEDRRTGILFEGGDLVGLTNALRELLSNMELSKEMGMRGLERIKEIGSLDKNLAKRLKIYLELADKS